MEEICMLLLSLLKKQGIVPCRSPITERESSLLLKMIRLKFP